MKCLCKREIDKCDICEEKEVKYCINNMHFCSKGCFLDYSFQVIEKLEEG